MLTGSALPSTATLHTTTSSATPTSPTRSSRLRGLSYLRSYTHNHLHSSSSSRNENSSPPLTLPVGRNLSLPATTPESTIQNNECGWLPTSQGRSRVSVSTESASPELNNSSHVGMTRNRAASAQLGPTPTASSRIQRRQMSHMEEGATASSDQQETQTPDASGSKDANALPTIRFIPHVETRSQRPSLQFNAVSRTLTHANGIVRVGRYSERDTAGLPTAPLTSATPVGFKSKVVSRRHCEFWCTNGQWYVKDVKSSSGTFLNHVRLSSPGVESRPYPVNDGDVVQLGIDFKGGEEVIFRCVKIRIECNRGWQKSLNSFNTSAHKRLLKNAGAAGTKQKAAAAGRDSDAASTSSSECSICLNPVAPCQALFVAPCSHVWHYKCIRNLIHGPNYPNFLCPNCRFVADLEAEVEQPEDFAAEDLTHDEEDEALEGENGAFGQQVDDDERASRGASRQEATVGDQEEDEIVVGMMESLTVDSRQGDRSRSESREDSPSQHSSSKPVAIARDDHATPTASSSSIDILHARSATPTSSAQFALAAGVINLSESSITGQKPRNDAGPFVLDGGAEDATVNGPQTLPESGSSRWAEA